MLDINHLLTPVELHRKGRENRAKNRRHPGTHQTFLGPLHSPPSFPVFQLRHPWWTSVWDIQCCNMYLPSGEMLFYKLYDFLMANNIEPTSGTFFDSSVMSSACRRTVLLTRSWHSNHWYVQTLIWPCGHSNINFRYHLLYFSTYIALFQCLGPLSVLYTVTLSHTHSHTVIGTVHT